MMTTCKVPLGPRIIVDLGERQLKSKGGIEIPDEYAQKMERALCEGIVAKIGELAFYDYPGEAWVQVGDTVTFSRYAGITYDENGHVWCALNDDDLILKKEIGNE